MLSINGGQCPPIKITGLSPGSPGTIDAYQKNKRVLYMSNGAMVTLGENLTIKRGAAGTAGDGGGVRVSNSTLVVDGAVVTGNSAKNGGGVYLTSGSKFLMASGSVTLNTSSDNAAGVGVYGESSCVINGGEVSFNTTANNFYGGGVFMSNTGGDGVSTTSFNMSAGSITGNIAYTRGGGVYFRYFGKLNKTGSSVIDGYNSGSDAGKNKVVDIITKAPIANRGHGVYAVGRRRLDLTAYRTEYARKETDSLANNNLTVYNQGSSSHYWYSYEPTANWTYRGTTQ